MLVPKQGFSVLGPPIISLEARQSHFLLSQIETLTLLKASFFK